MKTATVPQIHVVPEFRLKVEGILEQDGSLSEFVESAIGQTVSKRKNQTEFLHCGITAIEETKHAKGGTPAQVVVAQLEARLAAARQIQLRRKG